MKKEYVMTYEPNHIELRSIVSKYRETNPVCMIHCATKRGVFRIETLFEEILEDNPEEINVFDLVEGLAYNGQFNISDTCWITVATNDVLVRYGAIDLEGSSFRVLGKHGSPEDRGAADSFYGRPRTPHWYPEGTYNGKRETLSEMSVFQIAIYHIGFNENEKDQNFKDWGDQNENWGGDDWGDHMNYIKD